MNFLKRFEEEPDAVLEPELEEALSAFRLSVHAWSDAVLSQPRQVAVSAHQKSWRLAAGWALGCALVAVSLSGGLWEHHRRQVAANAVAAHLNEVRQQQRLANQGQAIQEQIRQTNQTDEADENLLAEVDTDVAREVPTAMEPLAQLMTADESDLRTKSTTEKTR